MTGREWKAFALAAGLAILAYQLVPAHGWWEPIWKVAVGYSGGIAVLVGTRRLPWRERLPWIGFALAVFSNCAGIAVNYYTATYQGIDESPMPSDAFFLGLYPPAALGLWLLIRRRDPRRDWTALVDATTMTTGLGLLAWVYVIHPATADDASLLGQIVSVAFPIGDLLLMAMVVRLVRGSGLRNVAFWGITVSLATFLVGDSCWVALDNMGDFGVWLEEQQWMYRLLDQTYLVGYVTFGVAALHQTARELGKPGTPRPARLSGPQLTLLTSASLIAPAILALQLHQGKVRDGFAIVVGCTALFLLVVARMAQLLRQVEQQSVQLRELSRLDELTGLPNRRAWNDELPRALEHARRDGSPISVAMLDIDRFKAFNDAYGHPAGDRLLKEASAAWHGALRQVDTLARYGGEEFIVLLPDADEDQAEQAVARALAVTPQDQTFSAGVAVWDGTETSDALIHRADTALYAAKTGGRNRIMRAAVTPGAAGERIAAPR
jgi:diguanylate cyclase (GGDEF)-like protein